MTAPVPPMTGVPAAPNGGFGALKYRPNTAAASGGKPRPMKSGAASAPGVPNPAAPSMIVMKPSPMSNTWMRLSSSICPKYQRMVAMAPLPSR